MYDKDMEPSAARNTGAATLECAHAARSVERRRKMPGVSWQFGAGGVLGDWVCGTWDRDRQSTGEGQGRPPPVNFPNAVAFCGHRGRRQKDGQKKEKPR
jgi:hypothetical protein